MKYPVYAVIFDSDGNMYSSRKQFELPFPPAEGMVLELGIKDSVILFRIETVKITPRQEDVGLEEEACVFLREVGMGYFWKEMEYRAAMRHGEHEFKQNDNWSTTAPMQ
jgi:hypothetical protein